MHTLRLKLRFIQCFNVIFSGGIQESLLSPREEEYLLLLLEQNPTLYVWEMQHLLSQHLGISVSEFTISHTLAKLGVTRKKWVTFMKRGSLQRTSFGDLNILIKHVCVIGHSNVLLFSIYFQQIKCWCEWLILSLSLYLSILSLCLFSVIRSGTTLIFRWIGLRFRWSKSTIWLE
jgi:hypothetical protein